MTCPFCYLVWVCWCTVHTEIVSGRESKCTTCSVYLHASCAGVCVKVLFDWLLWLVLPVCVEGGDLNRPACIKASRSPESTSNRTRSQYKTVAHQGPLRKSKRRDLSFHLFTKRRNQFSLQDVHGQGKVSDEER